MRFAIVILTSVLLPAWAEAQVTLPRNDAVVSVAWAGSEYALKSYDRWQGSLFLSASAGRYWTDHLKTDIEAAWTSAAEGETYEDLSIGGVNTFAHGRHRSQDIRLAIGQSFQFGRNAWVHPSLGAGADIVWRRTVLDRPAQQGFVYGVPTRSTSSVPVPAMRTSTSEVLAVPYVKTAVKMYASERAFFATELKLGFASDLDHVLWKLGMGFDF